MSMLTRILKLLHRQPPEIVMPQSVQLVRPATNWDLVLPIAWPAEGEKWRIVWVPPELTARYVAAVESYSRQLRRVAEEVN